MGDMGDHWRDVRPFINANSFKKKANNKENVFKLLKKKSVPFEVKNGGIHLVIDGHVDYWPTTGKFICRDTKTTGRGIFNLLKHINA